MEGEVVGINTAIVASGQGIGFAIPISLASGIIEQLKQTGEVSRGWLGVGIQDLTPELANYYGIDRENGVLITRVYKDNPADKAGIKPNDIIVAVDGKEVATSRELSRVIADSPIGKKTAIRLIRDGKEKTVYVKLTKRDDSRLPTERPAETGNELGIEVRELEPETARRFGFDEDEQGLLITAVSPRSKADQAGIQQGDLIKEINRRPVKSAQDFKARFDHIKAGETVQLLIRRGRTGFLVIKMTK
jgi:serine protease Do